MTSPGSASGVPATNLSPEASHPPRCHRRHEDHRLRVTRAERHSQIVGRRCRRTLACQGGCLRTARYDCREEDEEIQRERFGQLLGDCLRRVEARAASPASDSRAYPSSTRDHLFGASAAARPPISRRSVVSRARKLHKRLHAHLTHDEEQVVLNQKSRKAPTCGAFAGPSDGLEPSTPSLPWRLTRWATGSRSHASHPGFCRVYVLLRLVSVSSLCNDHGRGATVRDVAGHKQPDKRCLPSRSP